MGSAIRCLWGLRPLPSSGPVSFLRALRWDARGPGVKAAIARRSEGKPRSYLAVRLASGDGAHPSWQWCRQGMLRRLIMEKLPLGPLDAGQRSSRERRKSPKLRRLLRNRRTLMAVLWMVKIIVELARLIEKFFDGS